MPINPNIAMGYRPIQLENPPNPMNAMVQMSQIQNYQQTNQLNQMKMDEARRGMQEDEAVRNYFAQNPDRTAPTFGQGLYSVSPTQARDFEKFELEKTKVKGEIDNQKRTGRKTQGDIDKQFREGMEAAARAMSYDPSDAQIRGQLTAALSNPNHTPEQKAMLEMEADKFLAIPYEQRRAVMAQRGASVSDLKPITQTVNQGGQTNVLRIPAFGGAPTSVGTYPGVPLPPGVEAQQLRMRAAGAPNTNVSVSTGGQSDYIKALGKAVGETNAKVYTDSSASANSAVSNLPKLRETLDLITKSSAITGIGADIFTNIERVKKQFLATESSGKKVSDTEVLDALLGSDVFPMIQSLGIGARGMDTPAEREFLRKVMTGTINLDRNTLKRMTEIRISIAERAVKKYNDQVARGDFKDIGIAQNRAVERIELPKATPKPGKVDAANPLLN